MRLNMMKLLLLKKKKKIVLVIIGFIIIVFTLVLFVKLLWNKNKKVNHKYNDLRNEHNKNSSEKNLDNGLKSPK